MNLNKTLSNFLHKLLSHHQSSQITNEDVELEQFFINAKNARKIFEELANTKEIQTHLLVIHGIGGIGKSSLLKIYQSDCKKVHIPVALVLGEDVKSEIDILANWEEELNVYGIKLNNFTKTLMQYRTIQAKIEERFSKALSSGEKVAIKTVEKSSKAIGTAVDTMAFSGAGKIIDPLLRSIAELAFEKLIQQGKLEIDLFRDPSKKLTNDFLNDIEHVASNRRLVLMLDTFEQIKTLSGWVCGLMKRLPENILLVISGREIPEWDQYWPGWEGTAEIIRLEEMVSDDICDLVDRYFAYISKGDKPDVQVVKDIEQFARGLPMVATSAVQLWFFYGKRKADFNAVKPKVVADLADVILRDIPLEKRAVYELAAVLRYFDADALMALQVGRNAEELFNELRKWPFVHSRSEGFAVHDTMREMMNEALKMRTIERFYTIHKQAEMYYEKKMINVRGDKLEQFNLERLYHLICADEDEGIQLFREMAEKFVLYRQVNRLRTLLKDVNNYPIELEKNRLWRQYYNGKLAFLEKRLCDAEIIYSEIKEKAVHGNELFLNVLLSLSEVLTRGKRLSEKNGYSEALSILQDCNKFIPRDSLKWALFLNIRGNFFCRKKGNRQISILT